MYPVKIERLHDKIHRITTSTESECSAMSPSPIDDKNNLVVCDDPKAVFAELARYGTAKADLWDFITRIFNINKGTGSVLSLQEAFDSYITWCDIFKIKPVGKQKFSALLRGSEIAPLGDYLNPNDKPVAEFINMQCEFAKDNRVHCNELHTAFISLYDTTMSRNEFISTFRRLVTPRGAKKGPVMVQGRQAQGFRGVTLL